MATLVYAQLLNTPENKYMRFRDAYLFAAPIVCDRESVDSECTESLLYSHTAHSLYRSVFNAKMFENMKKATHYVAHNVWE